MPFRVEQTRVWASASSVQFFVAATNDVEVLVTTTGSVWLDGAAVAGPNAGMFLGADERWFRFTCEAADDLWAFSSRDVVLTTLIRSEAP